MLRNCDRKMYLLLATAVGLGASAVAACVVPLFYYKPSDNADEAREESEIRDTADQVSHSRFANDEISNSATVLNINGVNYVRFMAPPTLTTSFIPTGPTSTTYDSTILREFERCGNNDPIISGTIDSKSIRVNDVSAESTRYCEVLRASAPRFRDARPTTPSELKNLRDSYQQLIDIGTLGLQSLVPHAGSTSGTQSNGETPNPTEGFKTHSIDRIFTPTSVLTNFDSLPKNYTESRTMGSSISGPTIIESSAQPASTIVGNTSPKTLTPVGPSNSTVQSPTGTTTGISTSQESNNFSPSPTRFMTNVNVESARMSGYLEAIPEISPAPASSRRLSPGITGPSLRSPSRIDGPPNLLFVDNDGSIGSTSTRLSNPIIVHSEPRNGSPPVLGSPDSTQFAFGNSPDAGRANTSKKNRRSAGFSGRLKKIWRGLKRSGHKQHNNSVSSLCAEEKLSSGHSTMISEVQCHPETDPTRTSPKTLTTRTFRVFEEIDISSNNNRTYVMRPGIERLNSSSRSPPESGNDEATHAQDSGNRPTRSAGSCGKVFSGMTEYLRVNGSPKASGKSVGVSHSVKLRGEAPDSCTRDHNDNVCLDVSNCGQPEVEDTRRCCSRGRKAGGVRSECFPKSNGLLRRIKKIFHIGNEDRNKNNKISTSLRTGRVLNSVTVESQRNSAGDRISQRKRDVDTKVVATSVSPGDVSSYCDLRIDSYDERYFDLPSIAV